MKRKTSLRGLGTLHQQRRARWRAIVNGGCVRCARGADCERAEVVEGVLVGGLIDPREPWDLDHTEDRRGYLGPSHLKCNRSAGGRKGNARRRRVRSREW